MPSPEEQTKMPPSAFMPEAGSQPNMQPAMGVQTDELIDDVSDGADQTAPMNKGQINSLTDAREAFAQLLAAAGQQADAPTQNTTSAEPEETAPSPQQGQTEQPEQVEQQAEQSAPQQAAFEPMSKDSLREMLQEELQKAIAHGEIPNASREDIASDMVRDTEPAESLSNEQSSFNMPDITSDEFYAKISDDPGSAIMEVAEAIAAQKVADLQSRLQPLLDQSERVQKNQRVQDAIKKFSDRGYDDFGKYRQSMVDYLKQGNYDMEDPNAYELAYNRAKAADLQNLNASLNQKLMQSESQGRALVDYMHDPGSIDQMAQNEEVKRKVINDYLRSLSSGEKPQIISDSASSIPIGTDPSKPKNFKEAGDMFKRML